MKVPKFGWKQFAAKLHIFQPPWRRFILNEGQSIDFDALLPGQSIAAGANRRTALRVALGVGYAAVTKPIMTQTVIKTSSEGLSTGEGIYDVEAFSVLFLRLTSGYKRLARCAGDSRSVWRA
jgi:hypothetical protein